MKLSADILSKIQGKYIGFDLETRDPDLLTLGPGWAFPERGGYPVGYAIAWFDGDPDKLTIEDLKSPKIEERFQSVYVPVRHEGGGNVDMETARAIVQGLVGNQDRHMVMANCTYDYGWTLCDGYDWKSGIEDIQIQAPLIDDQRRSYSLNNLGKDYLGVSKSEDGLYQAAKDWGLKDPKGQLWKLPADLVEEYARGDAELTLRLFFLFRLIMAPLELERVHDLERSLVPTIYKMRKRGVKVNVDKAFELRKDFLSREKTIEEAIASLTSVKIDPWASATVIEALEAEGVSDFPKTPKKGEKSVDNTFLKSLAAHDNRAGKIAEQVLLLRRYNKARSTFVENMVLEHQQNGVIHGELKALRSDDGGTVSGRFSCSSPNLQQVPARDPELGPLIRGLFEPFNGLWASIDYKSQEPRLAVHFGVKANCRGAEALADRFRANPNEDPYLFTAEVCGITRKDAKTIRLGILYGMGGGKLCDSLGLPTKVKMWKGREILVAGPEGELLLEKFNASSPMDKELSELASTMARRRGYVKTVLGRRATFPRQPNGEVWFTHKALNRIIQGSAADMTKTAMVMCDAAGFLPLVSVHDELAFDVESEEQAREIAEIMSKAVPLEVPVACDVEAGRNWGESMG